MATAVAEDAVLLVSVGMLETAAVAHLLAGNGAAEMADLVVHLATASVNAASREVLEGHSSHLKVDLSAVGVAAVAIAAETAPPAAAVASPDAASAEVDALDLPLAFHCSLPRFSGTLSVSRSLG